MKDPLRKSIFFPAFLFLVLVGTGGCEFGEPKQPLAVQGVLDLTQWLGRLMRSNSPKPYSVTPPW